jgi:bifunctional enzyme CysN/CysC
VVVGSVDDGKSTLLGRLLYESDGIYDDQLSSVKRASRGRNLEIDLSLVTDGLRAEREQGITIDVAHRYFSTKRRKFIIADTPGHEQYTRNMATGASHGDVALILVDVRKGVLKQTRRHTLIAWLFGIRRMVVAINKMDLVGYDPEAFRAVCEEFETFAGSLGGAEIHFVPVSALNGDNVITASERMNWYRGPALLELLETIPAGAVRTEAFRFPVQAVIRPNQDFRGYAGQVVSGALAPGQEVVAYPSLQRTKISQILVHTRKLENAVAPLSVVVSLCDHIDLGRGDLLANAEAPPIRARRISAHLIWSSQTPMQVDARYLVKHTTQVLCGRINRLVHKIDIDTLEHTPAEQLSFNEIGMAEIETHSDIFCDAYGANRATGSFILIDPLTNDTVAAGMIVEAAPLEAADRLEAPKEFRAAQGGLTVWFTGLSGAGKTTICRAVQTELLAHGLAVEVLDGDVVRKHLCKDLGFTKQDRDENIRRIAFVSHLLTRNGIVVLVSAISPYRSSREEARRTIGNFLEVHVSAPLPVCEERDPKELYKKARSGKIQGFTGIDDPYEAPVAPEIVCRTEMESVQESSRKVVARVLEKLRL